MVIKFPEVFQVSDWVDRVDWRPFREGVEIHRLYGDGKSGPAAALIRFQPHGQIPSHEHVGYEHIIVLVGAQEDEKGRAHAGTLIINPPGSKHSVRSETGCVVLAIYEKPVRFVDAPEPARPDASAPVLLAVNGTLMRGLALNSNLLAAGAVFVRETRTEPVYRMWSIEDRHPAMIRVHQGGASLAVEIWSVPAAGLASILLQEPPGLSVGRVKLIDGSNALGVLGEPILCESQKEITAFGGWRAYMDSIAR